VGPAGLRIRTAIGHTSASHLDARASTIALRLDGVDSLARGVPAAGTLWIERASTPPITRACEPAALVPRRRPLVLSFSPLGVRPGLPVDAAALSPHRARRAQPVAARIAADAIGAESALALAIAYASNPKTERCEDLDSGGAARDEHLSRS